MSDQVQCEKKCDVTLIKIVVACNFLKQWFTRVLLLQNKWEAAERDLNREIEDLKERLYMGADEYKLRYLECRKLQSEIRKLQKQCKCAAELLGVI